MYDVAFILDWIFFILAGNKENYKVPDEFEIQPDPTWAAELADPDQLKKTFYLLENYSKYFDVLLALG